MKTYKFISKLITLFSLSIFLVAPVFAAQYIDYANCEDKFKDQQYAEDYKNLYFAVHGNNSATGSNNPLYVADCPPSLKDIEFTVIRIITILITIVGILVFVSFVMNSFTIMSSGANKDKIKKARGGIQMAIIGVIIIVMSYTLIAFVGTQLGLSNDSNNFSILDGGKLIFRFIFEY